MRLTYETLMPGKLPPAPPIPLKVAPPAPLPADLQPPDHAAREQMAQLAHDVLATPAIKLATQAHAMVTNTAEGNPAHPSPRVYIHPTLLDGILNGAKQCSMSVKAFAWQGSSSGDSWLRWVKVDELDGGPIHDGSPTVVAIEAAAFEKGVDHSYVLDDVLWLWAPGGTPSSPPAMDERLAPDPGAISELAPPITPTLAYFLAEGDVVHFSERCPALSDRDDTVTVRVPDPPVDVPSAALQLEATYCEVCDRMLADRPETSSWIGTDERIVLGVWDDRASIMPLPADPSRMWTVPLDELLVEYKPAGFLHGARLILKVLAGPKFVYQPADENSLREAARRLGIVS